jgi:hypothetical protein
VKGDTQGTVVVAGALAQTARLGGLTWVFLQYILGFRRLGWDVLFLDYLEPAMCTDAAGKAAAVERSTNLAYFLNVMDQFDLGGRFSLFFDGAEQTVGLPRSEVVDRVDKCTLFLNVSGYFQDEHVREAAASRLVYLDIDPGFAQMWFELGLADPFRGHDAFVTIGENIGKPDCEVPTCGLEWITMRQPVVLDFWPARACSDGAVTTVASWRGPNSPIEYRGKTYGLRVHEFRKFFGLPQASSIPFQAALDIHADERRDLQLLHANGWSLVDPAGVAPDPWSYRDYVQRSRAELMVAKGMYVETRSGWFSDRSICYLASGKPVLVQDTGLGDLYPIGEGLLTFSTLDEAIDGVEAICRDYERHARAARLLAEEYFGSDRVLGRLLQHLEVE